MLEILDDGNLPEKKEIVLKRLVKKFQKLLIEKHCVSNHQAEDKLSTVCSWLTKQGVDLFISVILLIATVALAHSYISVETCPTDYDEFIPYRGKCYKISGQVMTWQKAKTACNKSGGFLLEVYTPTEMEYLKKILNK